jgi:uncharacterized membrane protein YkoI
MRNSYLYAGSAATLMLAAGLAFAAETQIMRSDLPPAVEKTVQQQSVGATIKGFSKEVEGGQVVYEIKMTVNGHGKDVDIATDGTVLEIEEEVELSSIPASAQSALSVLAKGAKIVKVESVTKRGKIVSYEAKVLHGSKKSEIAVGPNGEAVPQDND